MLIQPINYFLLIWFVLAAGSTAYFALDQFGTTPSRQGGGGLMLIIDVE